MADELPNIETTPAASPVTVEVAPSPTAPVVETPAVETPTPAPETPAEAPAAEPVVVPEASKPETLLGSDKKIEEAKPEAKAEDKTAEVKAEEPKVELPAFEPFTVEEGVTFEPERMSEFTKTLAEFETTTKASHEEVQKFGQQLIDRHVTEVKDAVQRYTKSLTDAWTQQKTDDWKAFQSDPEFANRTTTVGNAAMDAITVYAGNAKQQEEFRNLMETRGVGNHPAMIRLLSNVMLAKAEPKQLAASQVASPVKQSKISKMYGVKTA